MPVMRWIAVNATFLTFAGVILLACGSDEPADDGGSASAKCGVCEEPDASVDLTTPAVSFATDVFPILRQTCNGAACHGVPPALATDLYPGAKLYLGPPANDLKTPVDAALLSSIVTGLKADSKTSPSQKVVTPSDPSSSFLIHKIHGCQNEHATSCDAQSDLLVRCKSSACGDVMPPVDQLVQLTVDQKNIFRRWVAQGALDN